MRWLRIHPVTFVIAIVVGAAAGSLGGLLFRERPTAAPRPLPLTDADRSYERLFAGEDPSQEMQRLPAPEAPGAHRPNDEVRCNDRPMDSLPHPTAPGKPMASDTLRRGDEHLGPAPCAPSTPD